MVNTARNSFGLTERDVKTILDIMEKYPEVRELQLFGSRAKGNFKFGSDIDLAIINKDVSAKTIASIISDLEESSLPYNVDIVSYPTLRHKPLIDHINRIGIIFYVAKDKKEI